MTHDSDDWEQRYQDGELGWDLGTAAPPLLRAAKTLPRSRAVVVGCGTGHEALALARLGFEVTGVDFAPSAIERARANAAQAKSPARFLQADVLQLPGSEAPWPLWVEHTCFCAIDPAQRELEQNQNSFKDFSITTYDSLGAKHELKMVMWKTAPNQWDWKIDGSNMDITNAGVTEAAGTHPITFSADGSVDPAVVPPEISFTPAQGGSPVSLKIDLGTGLNGLSQFAGTSNAVI